MKVSMWAAAKDGMSFAWQVKDTVLGFATVYGFLFVGLVWALQSFGLSYADPAAIIQTTATDTVVSWDAQTLNMVLQVFGLFATIAGGYYFLTSFIRRADNPTVPLAGSFGSYALQALVVKSGPALLLAGLSMIGLPIEVMAALIVGFIVVQVALMRLELSVVSTAVNGPDQAFTSGLRLGTGYAFKMFLSLIATIIIVLLVFIPVDFAVGTMLKGLIAGDGIFLFYALMFLQAFKAGTVIAVSALVLGAYYCALRPEYGFVDDDMFYAIGVEEDDIADNEKIDEQSDAKATAVSSGYSKKS